MRPKILYFLNDILNVPVSSQFWHLVLDVMEGKNGLLGLSEDEENSWFNMATELSDGECKIKDLLTILPQIREMFDHLRKMILRIETSNSKLIGLDDIKKHIHDYAPIAANSPLGVDVRINNWFA